MLDLVNKKTLNGQIKFIFKSSSKNLKLTKNS